MTYSSNDKNGKYAETKYNKIFSNNNYTLIRVKLITGRKNQRVFIVHRLDRDTSGLVIFAKSEKVKLLLQDNWNNIIL